MKTKEDFVFERASTLASACFRGNVKDNQLGQVLAHLKRHRNVTKTRELLESLARSCFAKRTRVAGEQFQALETHVASALTGISDWQRAAEIVAWGRRLLKAPRETRTTDGRTC
jgi:hypothetical protein